MDGFDFGSAFKAAGALAGAAQQAAQSGQRGDGWGAAGAALRGVSDAAGSPVAQAALGAYAPAVQFGAGLAAAALPAVQNVVDPGKRRTTVDQALATGHPDMTRWIQNASGNPNVTPQDVVLVNGFFSQDPNASAIFARVMSDPNARHLHDRILSAILGIKLARIKQLQVQLAQEQAAVLELIRKDQQNYAAKQAQDEASRGAAELARAVASQALAVRKTGGPASPCYCSQCGAPVQRTAGGFRYDR